MKVSLAPSWTPSTILADRYEVGPVIGSGGMGQVYDGWDRRLERPVALKLLRPEMADDPVVSRRFRDEARSAAGLSHPNVVAVYDSDASPEPGHPAYIVMERLPGRTLKDVMAAGPMAQADVIVVGQQILAALDAAHRAGLVHRDIKPSNILVAGEGHWKVADFGIAKSLAATEASSDDTMTGMVIGSPAYLAPERLRGQPATVATDLYAVGVILEQALDGARLDRHLRDVLTRSLAMDPAQRFEDAAQMSAALGRPGPDGGQTTVLLPPAVGGDTRVLPAAPAQVPGRRRAAMAGAAVIGAVAVAILVALLGAGSTGPRAPRIPATSVTTARLATATTVPPTTAPPATVPPTTAAPPAHGGHGHHHGGPAPVPGAGGNQDN